MGDKLQWAQAYIKRGWHIIPLQINSKIPAVPSVIEYRGRYPTSEELKKWFLYGNHNIGILTGPASGLFVIDIDDPSLIAEYEKKYPTQLSATTPRGGRHFFYAYTGSDLTISAGALGPKVDTRGEGGYVVAAPSRVVYDTGIGEGIEPGYSGSYQWVSKGQPGKLSDEIAVKLRAVKPVVGSDPVTGDDAWEKLAQVISGVNFPPGQHNEWAKDIARLLFRYGMREDGVIKLSTILNKKDPTPQESKILVGTVKSGINYEQQRLAATVAGANGEVIQPAFRVVKASEVISDFAGYDVNWLVEDWVPENGLIGLFAPPESYKTWTLLDAAISVALGNQGEPFLNAFDVVGGPKPVLIVQQEDYIGQVAMRLRTILTSKAAPIKYRSYEIKNEKGQRVLVYGAPQFADLYVHPDSALRFNDQFSMAALEETIKSLGIKLVVIDPLYMLEAIDDKYFAGAAQGGMAALKQLRNKYGVTFILAHHTNKKGLNGRDAMFGSQLLNGAFEGVWMISQPEGSQLQIVKQGKSFKKRQSYLMDFEIDTSPAQTYGEGEAIGGEVYKVTVTDQTTNVLSGKHDHEVLAVLEAAREPLTQTEIAKEIGISSKLVSDSLKRMKTQNFVVQNNKKWNVPTQVEF